MTKDPFRTRDHVADFDDIVADIAVRSAATRAKLRMVPNLAYGAGPDERLDLFLPSVGGVDRPVHLFIHGGYWRMFSKEDFSYVANTIVEAGGIAVIIDYSLMPKVRLAEIVEQVRRALRWVQQNIAAYGGDPHNISVSGHSAGAHLATSLFRESDSDAEKGIQSAVLLGGIYDLKPLQSSFLKPLIGITDAEAAEFSPLHYDSNSRVSVMIMIGSQETSPFIEQAHEYCRHLRRRGHVVKEVLLFERNHMNSMVDLGDPNTDAGRALQIAICERQS